MLDEGKLVKVVRGKLTMNGWIGWWEEYLLLTRKYDSEIAICEPMDDEDKGEKSM